MKSLSDETDVAAKNVSEASRSLGQRFHRTDPGAQAVACLLQASMTLRLLDRGIQSNSEKYRGIQSHIKEFNQISRNSIKYRGIPFIFY